jgi:hypothetical protein
VAEKDFQPPLTFNELHDHAGRILQLAETQDAYRNWVTVLLNSETWRRRASTRDLRPQLLLGLVKSGPLRKPLHVLRDGFVIDGFGAPHYVELIDGKCRVLDNSLLGQVGIEIDVGYIELGDERRAQFVKLVHETGRRGRIPVPRDPESCKAILARYRAYHDQALSEFAHQAAQRTANEKLQAKVVGILRHKLSHGDAR